MTLPKSPAPANAPGFGHVLGIVGMHEHHHSQLLHFGPERIVLRHRQRLACHVAADRDPAHAQLLHGVLGLLRGQIWKLQRRRGERHEAVRMRRAPFRQTLVVHSHDLRGQVAIRGIPPKGVDIDRLHIDAALVQLLNAIRSQSSGSAAPDRSSGVPFTTSATSAMLACACTSTTLTRFPPTRTSRRAPERPPAALVRRSPSAAGP